MNERSIKGELMNDPHLKGNFNFHRLIATHWRQDSCGLLMSAPNYALLHCIVQWNRDKRLGSGITDLKQLSATVHVSIWCGCRPNRANVSQAIAPKTFNFMPKINSHLLATFQIW